MHKLILTVAVLLWSSTLHAQEARQPFSAVQDLFAAMSAYDGGAMKATSTDDFELLEVGEVWDMDKLISVVTGGDENTTRRNFFAVITSKVSGDRAWVSYWNRALFTFPNGQTQTIKWLESAVLVKYGDRWLIEMLHSTRLGPNQPIPDSVTLQEYVTPAR